MTAPTDECLVRATLDGEDEAFAGLVHRHKTKIFGIAARFTRNDHELDDLCQEIFLRAYRSLSKFRGEAPFEHWLSRIAVLACYDFLRRTRRDRDMVSLDDHPAVLQSVSDGKNVAAEEARELLQWAMAQILPEERLILTLLELEEKSVREIAEWTGWSESKVKVRAFRARQSLQNILKFNRES